jgi:hypothetical protein
LCPGPVNNPSANLRAGHLHVDAGVTPHRDIPGRAVIQGNIVNVVAVAVLCRRIRWITESSTPRRFRWVMLR